MQSCKICNHNVQLQHQFYNVRIHFDGDTSIYHDQYIHTTSMCIDTVSLSNVSRCGDISIYYYISTTHEVIFINAHFIYHQLNNQLDTGGHTEKAKPVRGFCPKT